MARGYSAVKWSGGNVHSPLRVDRGLIECARYIRNQPPTNAVVQDSHLDKFLILGGLSDRPSFAARVDMWTRAKRGLPRIFLPGAATETAKTAAGDKHSGFAAQRARNWNSLVRGSSRRSQRLASRVSRSAGIRVQRLSSLRHAALFRFARLIFAGRVAVARRFY